MKPVAVPASKIGQFYSGDCYIVFYSYRENAGHGKLVQIVYYWIVSAICILFLLQPSTISHFTLSTFYQ